MSEIVSVSSAIAIVKKLKQISDKIKNADFQNLLADLNLRLAEIKTQWAECMEENGRLKTKISTLEVTGERCPRCLQLGWRLEASGPDLIFGEAGGIRRRYKCALCGLSEEKFVEN
jgi:hypothetical protein